MDATPDQFRFPLGSENIVNKSAPAWGKVGWFG